MNEFQRHLAAQRAQAQRAADEQQSPAAGRDVTGQRPIEDEDPSILQPDREKEEWEKKSPKNWHLLVLGIVVLMGLIPLFYSKWGWSIWHYLVVSASVLAAIYAVKKLELGWEMIICHLIYKWKWLKIMDLVWWFFLFWVAVNFSRPYQVY